LLQWLKGLKERVPAAHTKAQARIKLLALEGNDLRRPVIDYLRDGIYEIRWKVGRVNYRILYFFHDEAAVTLSHGLTKEGKVEEDDIELAFARCKDVRRSAAKFTKTFEVRHG
jgi:phage-related protein